MQNELILKKYGSVLDSEETRPVVGICLPENAYELTAFCFMLSAYVNRVSHNAWRILGLDELGKSPLVEASRYLLLESGVFSKSTLVMDGAHVDCYVRNPSDSFRRDERELLGVLIHSLILGGWDFGLVMAGTKASMSFTHHQEGYFFDDPGDERGTLYRSIEFGTPYKLLDPANDWWRR